ncbi:DUF2524 family protein [Bacillus alkalicellulosilyticus]|uniref:DUF2524 family protein n=1 Tax=Alkalihalobacterium alkalicellulosilyticum TaxID=1912214 RepID=UPI001482DB89|nr:DUF2524 family protein [Bacillus alkalicellulosilyticus]
MNTNEITIFINKAEQTIDQALNELAEVKIVRENDPSDFAYAQHQLQELQAEAEDLLEKVEFQERPVLVKVKQRLQEVQETMIRGI